MDEASRRHLSRKIKSVDELKGLIGPRPRDKKVIMCHGTFDVVHPGHIRHLAYAKTKGDILVASLTADAHVSKANVRPYVPEDLRALNLAALEMIDYVIIDRDPTPLQNLEILQPDFYAKGYEYSANAIHVKTREELKVLEGYGGEIIFTPGDIVYSSSRLIELEPPAIQIEKLIMTLQGEGISFDDLRGALDRMRGLRVHVVGDTIVDSYTYCSMIGGQVKTPTLSLRFERQADFVGGAGVVAKHLRAAGAEVIFSTVLGDDKWRDFVLKDLANTGIQVQAIADSTRPTTNKNAIVAGGYRMLKVDTLDNRTISDRILETLTQQVRQADVDLVVCSDFRHGIFNRQTIPTLVSAIPQDAFRVADSQVASRWGNILEFEGFDLITPNEREARFALGDQDSVVRPLATQLFEKARCRTLVLKLGERGILTYRTRESSDDPRTVVVIDSFAANVVDAVGSGDALLAYASLAYRATGNDVIASVLGNIAAGLECEYDGNVPITPEAVLKRLDEVEKRVNLAA
ncbi:MAG: PfkB family carbohydrate kinase [Alphaproteobacteria bacterium]